MFNLEAFRKMDGNGPFLKNIVSFLNKIGPFLKKIGCFFHVKRRKKPPVRRLFKGLPLCWCKYTASEGETQMLINVLLDSELGLLRFFHTRLCRRFPAFAGLLRQFQEHLPQLLFVLVARETPAQAGVHTRNVLARCTDQRSGHGTLYSENGELADPTLHPGQMLVTGRQCIIHPPDRSFRQYRPLLPIPLPPAISHKKIYK